MKFTKILAWHLLIGVPAAALAHSAVQYAYEAGESPADLGWLLVHFLFGLGCGLPVLAPAYSSQSCVFALLVRLKANWPVQVAVGAAFQAALVGVWAATVGVQPSLGGNFPMTPVMVAAAAVVGGLVAGLNCRLVKGV